MNYKLGRKAARHPVGLRWIEHYLVGSNVPTPPKWVAYPGGEWGADSIDWGMLGNDQYGDCTCAGMAHLFMANAATYKQPIPTFDVNAVTSLYFQLSGGQDSGLVESDVLAYAHASGMWGNTIAGYAPGNVHNPDILKVIIAEFRAAYLGVSMPAVAMTQFQDGQAWDLTNGPADDQIEGGHCVTAIGYNPEVVYVVTWGRVQKVTWRWLARYMEESWAVLTPQDAKVNLAALQRDLAAIPTYQ